MANGADGSIVIDTELDNTGVQKGSAELERRLNSLVSAVNKFGASLQKSTAGYGSTVAEIMSKSFTDNAAGLAAKLEQLGKVKIPTDTYKEICTEAEKAEQQLEKLYSRQDKMEALGVKEDSASWKSLQYDIRVTTEAYNRATAAKERMEANGTAFTLGMQTAEYQQLAAAVAELSAEEERLQADVTANEAPASRLGGVFSALGERLREAGSAALTTAKNLATMPFRAVANGVKQAVKELKQYAKQTTSTKNLTNSLTRALSSFKRLLVTRIKRTFISAIFNNVKEGLQALARYSAQFNAVMSEMKNAATQSAGNISVALGNLISTIAPVILRLINLLSTAISYLNQFFALLNGKTTYTRAKKGTEDYAKAASDAASAQKEFNAELYGYDELTRQSKNDGGGGGGADTSGIEYEEIPIDLPEGVTDWIERLKEAWKNGDWYNVGTVIADGLNVAIQTVDDWINNTLRPEGVKWAERIALILNGIFDRVEWKTLGKTVADGFNAIVDIVVTFFKTLSFKSVVQAVEDFLASALQNIDPLALLTVAFLPTLLKAVKTLIKAHPVATIVIAALLALGPQLGETLKKMVENIKFEEVGKAISDGLIWVFSRLTDAFASVDWYELGNALMQGLIDMLININWLQVLATLGSCIISLVGGAVELLLGLIGGLSQKLADAFSLVGEDGIAGFFQGIADAMRTAATWIKEHIVDPVVNAVKDFFGIHSPSTVFAELGRDLIQGLFEGISQIWHIITDFFSNALANLKATLSAAWENIKTTATNAWNTLKTNVTNAFTNTKNAITTTANNIRTGLNTTWNNVKSTASSAWNALKNTAVSTFSSLHTTLTSKWQSLRSSIANVEWGSIGTNLVNGLKNGISNAWSGLMTKVQSLVTSLTNKVKSLFGVASPSKVFAEIGGYLDEGLAQGLENGKRGLLTTAANIANAVTNGMTPDAPQVDMTADSVISGMQAIISGLGNIAATFKTIADTLSGIGGFTMPQIAAGTVVPYRTRVDTAAPGTGDSEGDTGYLMSILAELQALVELLRAQGNSDSDIKVIIDGREVFNVVVAENNRAIQRTGASPIRV